MNKLIIGLVIGILTGGIGGYLISGSIKKAPNQERFTDFQIDENAKQEIISYFENNGFNEINSYCEQNRKNCFYYCTEVNQEHEVCDGIIASGSWSGPGGQR